MPAFVNRTLGGYNNTSSWLISVPASVANDDILLWRLTIDRTSVTCTTPSGWDLVDGPRDQSGAARSYLFKRIASSEPANYTATLSGAAHGSAVMIAYTDVSADPVQATSPAGTTTASTSTPSTAAIVPDEDDCMIVAFYGADSGSTKLPISDDASPDATERAETEQNSGSRFYSTYVQEYLQATAASQALDITAAGAEVWMTQIVALRPGGAVAPLNTVAPVVSGTKTSGQTLSCTTGTWDGAPTPTYTYQWQVDTNGDLVYGDISLATASTFPLTDDEIGCNVRCVVTATNASGSDSEPSQDYGLIGAAYSGSGTVGLIICGSGTGSYTPPEPANGTRSSGAVAALAMLHRRRRGI
jgi:hypothetical protein